MSDLATSAPRPPPEGVRVRQAAVKDFERVAQLLAEIERPEITPEKRGLLRGVYERHLAKPETGSLIAELEGEVVGYVTVEYRDRLNYTTQEAWVADLVVTEAHRARGIGRVLMEAVFREAVTRKAHRVRLESGHHRERAHRFYVSLGMEDAGRFFVWLPPR